MSIFHHVAVLLDQCAPGRGAFCHALDWARHLRLPLRGISIPASAAAPRENCVKQYEHSDQGNEASSDAPSAGGLQLDESGAEIACARACAQTGISWQVSRFQGNLATGVRQQTQRDDLFVFGQALPPAQKKDLLQQALREDAPAALVCPDAWAPLSRVLVVDQGSPTEGRFLETAAELCRCFRAGPIVLTAARFEQAARLRQCAAREVFRHRGVDADFDLVAGTEVGEAVVRVALWRRCQLAVVALDDGPPWRRWLRGSAVEELLGSAEPITVLALPSRPPAG